MAGVDDTRLRQKIAEIQSIIPRIEQQTIASLALFLEGEMKREAPVRTSRLRTSIEAIVQQDRATVGSSVVYAIMVARGTKPHRIEPKNKLALKIPGLGFPVRGVNHPGTSANPFDLRGLATLKANAPQIADQVKFRMLAGLSR